MTQSTIPQSEVTRRREQLEHLAQVQALSQAIASAILAIEKNDLGQLEIHLAAQETICNRLSGTKVSVPRTAKPNTVANDDPEALLLQEFRQAHMTLAQLNRVYAALLKRARRSVGLIAALYRSQSAGYDRDPAAGPQRYSWSCEV
jgi:hypothetical protein